MFLLQLVYCSLSNSTCAAAFISVMVEGNLGLILMGYVIIPHTFPMELRSGDSMR